MSRDRSGKRAQVGAVEPEEIESHIAGAPRAAEKLVTGRGEYCGDTAPPRVVNTRHDKLLKSLKWKRPITDVMSNVVFLMGLYPGLTADADRRRNPHPAESDEEVKPPFRERSQTFASYH
jgi:hypothetical protein